MSVWPYGHTWPRWEDGLGPRSACSCDMHAERGARDGGQLEEAEVQFHLGPKLSLEIRRW